jgi:hypothetical protein
MKEVFEEKPAEAEVSAPKTDVEQLKEKPAAAPKAPPTTGPELEGVDMATLSSMGRNDSIDFKGNKYHIQSEVLCTDGIDIQTLIYCSGRVIHSITSTIGKFDEFEIQLQLNYQHKRALEDVKAGKYGVFT